MSCYRIQAKATCLSPFEADIVLSGWLPHLLYTSSVFQQGMDLDARITLQQPSSHSWHLLQVVHKPVRLEH